MIIELINEAVDSGAHLEKAATAMGLSVRTVIRWRQSDIGDDRRKGPDGSPTNKLSEQERIQIVQVANSAAYRDMSCPNLRIRASISALNPAFTVF